MSIDDVHGSRNLTRYRLRFGRGIEVSSCGLVTLSEGMASLLPMTIDSPLRWTRGSLLWIWIFVGFLALYSINGRSIAEVDCDVAPYAAWNIVRHGSFDVSAYPVTRALEGAAAIRTRNGLLVSKYPPGSTLAAIPFVAPLASFQAEPLSKRSRMRRLGKLIASSYVAATIVLIWAMIRRLAPSAAVPATLLAGAGTMLWSTASQGFWAHGPATFFLALALFLLLGNRNDLSLVTVACAGICLGMAILSRPTTGLFAVASVLGLLFGKRWRESVVLIATVSVIGGLLVAYNQHYFGNFLAGGYLEEASAWSTPLHVGLGGLLVAPSRGLLVYIPAFILLPLGLIRLAAGSPESADERRMVAAWIGATAATVLVYAKWHAWWGGWTFGPRFLIEAIPVWILLFAFAYQYVCDRWGANGRRVVWFLILASVTVQFVGVFGYHVDWMDSHGAADMFSLDDTQIGSRVRVLITKRPVSVLLPILVIVGTFVRCRHVARQREPDPTIS